VTTPPGCGLPAPATHRRDLSGGSILIGSVIALFPAQPPSFQTTRMVELGPGRSSRAFTLRERAGVILLNRIDVVAGARVIVTARIPGVAGARVVSRPQEGDPSLSCARRERRMICVQGEEWCPMPAATWRVRLTKLSGPAGLARFDFVIAVPP